MNQVLVLLLLTITASLVSGHEPSISGRAPVMCTYGQRRPNDAKPNTFFDCQGGIWKLTNCPTGATFSPTALQCQLGNQLIEMPEASLQNCNSGEIYPDNLNTTMFYVCYNGALQRQVCPQGMAFSSTKKYCEIANNACGDTPHGGFVKSNQPNNFYVCQNGQLQLQICPSGQVFNPSLGYCSVNGLFPGGIRPPPPPPPPTPSFSCGPIQQGQFVADLNDERNYFVCILGQLRRQSCGANMVFNNMTLNCVRNLNATKEPGSCGPYAPGYCFSDCNSNNTNVYFQCTLGVFIPRECPVGQIVDSGCKCVASSNSRQSTLLSSNNNLRLNVMSQQTNLRENSEFCADGYLYNRETKQCTNPCDARDPNIPSSITSYYVPDTRSPKNFFLCNGKYVGKTGISTQLTEIDRLECPNGQQFYAALSSRPDPCMSRSTISKYCRTNPTLTLVALTANQKCKTPSLNPYFINCGKSIPSIERCPRGSVLYSGKCLATGYQCDSTTVDKNSQNYICICE